MSGEANNETIFYTSVYRHGVDEKRRVQVPSKWRPENADWEYMLILWPNGGKADENILVLPPKRMLALTAKLSEMSSSDPEAQSLRRLVGSKSASTRMDKAGRFMMNEEMAKKAGIDKEAVLVGLVDRFEIWAPDRYDKISVTDEVLLPEAFKLI